MPTVPSSGSAASRSTISFEFFPPKTADATRRLWATIRRLESLQPSFVSMTYGADGSTRELTQEFVERISSQTSLIAVPHLTCVGASRGEIDDIVDAYWEMGVRNVLALRGDPPKDVARFEPGADGFKYAVELVRALKSRHDFEISVACHPEGHPEATSPEREIEYLKQKFDAGAVRGITQFFFDNDTFLRFRDRAVAAGIVAPLVPGIMPVHNFKQLSRFAAGCNASIPDWLRRRFEGLDEDRETQRMIAAATAIEQVEALRKEGVDSFHFYTLNRAELTYAVCRALDLRHQAAA